ncbi:MAG: ankyrin repeat domain-containing protein [Alphaproteobacteria bacterium]|nr:ankyrin repeat domain-containing protein [Alphaproteobacteria bacterium]
MTLGTARCHGETPLTCLTKYHDLPMIKMLVEAGADINKPNNAGNTPLIIAVSPKKGFYIDEMDLIFDKAYTGMVSGLADSFGANRLMISSPEIVLGDKNPVRRLQKANRTDIDLENYFTYQAILQGGPVLDDIVQYLLDNGADVDIVNNYNENALFSAVDTPHGTSMLGRLLRETKLNDLISSDSGNTIPIAAYCNDHGYSRLVMFFNAGYDKNTKRQDGKTLCDVVDYNDFKALKCSEIECNTANKGRISPCAIPGGYFDWDECVDKRNGTRVCDGTKWGECTFDNGDNKCRYYVMDGYCEGDSETRRCCTKNQNTSSTVDSQQAALDSQKEYEQAREKEKAGRAGTAIATAATGLGGYAIGSSLSEQLADKNAEADMNEYLKGMNCNYSGGGVASLGETVEIPGGDELFAYYNEYRNLANNLKQTKAALNLTPGLEAQVVYENSNLYQYSSRTPRSGSTTSLARALMDENSDDAAAWVGQKDEAAGNLRTGAAVAAGGVVVGIGNRVSVDKTYDKTRMGSKNSK